MNKYWETETPIEVDTGKNILKYYPEAGRLQVCMPNWTDGAGEAKQGKTVTLNLVALYECEDKSTHTIFTDIMRKLSGDSI